MSLPTFQDPNQTLMLMQSKWRAQLNPVLANALVNGGLLSNQQLSLGSNTFNHGLGRTMQGWFITDITAQATVYRAAPFNAVTLTLNAVNVISSCTISLWVF